MASTPSAYHRGIAEEKRAAILAAALTLFVERGYDGTSLARVAEAAAVSTATLFKRFPTKADLFEAIVRDFWRDEGGASAPPASGEPVVGLRVLMHRYAALLRRDGMVGLHRMVVAEAPRFPELARIQFGLGKEPFFDEVRRYVEAERDRGTLRIDDPVMAVTQLQGMVSNFVLWPKLLLASWDPTPAEVAAAVDEAVRTFLARYGA